MLQKVGLLPTHNYQQIRPAYKLYSRTDARGQMESAVFKKMFSIDVAIEFMGIW